MPLIWGGGLLAGTGEKKMGFPGIDLISKHPNPVGGHVMAPAHATGISKDKAGWRRVVMGMGGVGRACLFLVYTMSPVIFSCCWLLQNLERTGAV
jgi:hypothetical protein